MKRLFIIIPIIIALLFPIIFLFNKIPLYYNETIKLANELKKYYEDKKEEIKAKNCSIIINDVNYATETTYHKNIQIQEDKYYFYSYEYNPYYEKRAMEYYFIENDKYYFYDAISVEKKEVSKDEYYSKFESINSYTIGKKYLDRMLNKINSKNYLKYEYYKGNKDNLIVKSTFNESNIINPIAIKYFLYTFYEKLFVSFDEVFTYNEKYSTYINYNANINLPYPAIEDNLSNMNSLSVPKD